MEWSMKEVKEGHNRIKEIMDEVEKKMEALKIEIQSEQKDGMKQETVSRLRYLEQKERESEGKEWRNGRSCNGKEFEEGTENSRDMERTRMSFPGNRENGKNEESES